VSWLQGTLLGTLATSIAIIAVAWVGMLMLAGRLEIRRGLTVVAGCFLLFGASAIAGGIRGVAGLGGGEAVASYAAPAVAPPPIPPQARPATVNPDPYSGASLPGR